ncbi:MAG: phosphatase PAP2 family protein [Alphaproteobacteria bacterium]|nr:MAG: phosphatase PAP2 family protein [Alphaproteobacteria bacterium]
MLLTNTLPRVRASADLLPADRLFWTVLAAIAAIVPAWERLLSVDITGLSQALSVAAAMLAVRALYVAVRPGARIVHTVLENGAGIVAYTAILAPVSYLCARNTMPLFDDVFHAADARLGYDWLAWAAFENGVPAVATILKLAYASLLPQTVLVLVVLPIIGDGRRGFSFIRASLIAVIVACAGSYLFPAAGPQGTVTDWYPHWAALRTAEPFTTSLSQVQGIIAFPSFHASLAVLLLFAVRGLGVVTWAFGALEVLMLMATPTHGHHYLCDVIAGVGVAVGALLLTNCLDRWFPLASLASRDA